MKIESSKVEKIRLSELDRLDPIDVILEDIAPRQGKITISCYGKSWTAYWGGMGDCVVSDFFCSCDEHYLANSLSGSIRATETDFEAIRDLVVVKVNEQLKHICNERKEEFLDASDARDQYDDLKSLLTYGVPSFECEADIQHWKYTEKVFGGEWWHFDFPTKSNADYEYLCRIIIVVQNALRRSDSKIAA